MAGLGRKIFTAGDVLTASDVQNYLMDQTVMNFAGTAARSSAIATPTQGMVSYRDDIDNLELYNGSAWVSASGLQLIKKQTIGSAVSSVTVTGAFSATYENYVIKVSGGVGSTSAASIGLQIGSSTTLYALGAAFAPFSTGTPGAYSNATNTSSFINIGSSGTNYQVFDVNVNSPFLARFTTVSSNYPYTGGAVYYAGILSDTTSHTAFTLTAASGTMTGGTIYVYGLGV
jgi:hypothetical protein